MEKSNTKNKKCKIYDVIEKNKITYHCYKNKVYDDNKQLCGLILNKKFVIFEDEIKKIKDINDKYLYLIKNFK
jgi:hypothetical protein